MLDEALKISHEGFVLFVLRILLVIIFVSWDVVRTDTIILLIEFGKLTFTLITFVFSLRLFLTVESTALRRIHSPVLVLQSLKSFFNSSVSLINRYLIEICRALRPKWSLISSIIVDFFLNLLSS